MENLDSIKKILVTGSEGYIGSVLVNKLLDYGYDVTGMDTCFYSEGNLINKNAKVYKLIKKDIRDIKIEDLESTDAVIHLAALSNDPLGKLNEDLTYQINYQATANLARLSKETGVKRFIFSSSCSLYGFSNDLITENHTPNPQTAYGKSKILAEESLKELADDNFSPVFLRNATVYGISPRMRFDLVVNSLCGYAKTENEIKILGDGTPWRPLVNINDVVNIFKKMLELPKNKIHNKAFNVGDENENYQVLRIAEKVKEVYKDCLISVKQKKSGDTRNYKVSFNRLNEDLEIRTSHKLIDGIKYINNVYSEIALNKELFDHRYYTRLKQIEYLMITKKIDTNLRWIKN